MKDFMIKDRKEYYKKYYQENRIKILEKRKGYFKQYYIKNRDKLLKNSLDYYRKNKTTKVQFKSKYYERNNIKRKFNKETKKQMSLSAKGKPKSKKHIENLKKSINSGKFIKGDLRISGINNHGFNNYSSFEPYGKDFNNGLKEIIRKRDQFRCQQCFRHQNELFTKKGRKRRLTIHHIDFNKQNNNPDNLISLCLNCHSQTLFNREDWIKYFQNKKGGDLIGQRKN